MAAKSSPVASIDCGGDREDEAFMGGVRWGRALNGKIWQETQSNEHGPRDV